MTMDGPFAIYVRDPETGELTEVLASGEHYKTEPDTWALAEDLLAPYRVTPPLLQNVWAGDDPAAPVLTIPLRFADVDAAEAVKAALAAL